MAEVRLIQVTKAYRTGTVAVRDLDLTAKDGELLVVMGPSGCGKTTTLRLVAGLESPTRGSIFIGGHCVDQWSARRRNVAMVFQKPALYPHLNVGENLEFSEKMKRAFDPNSLTEVVDALGLGKLLKRKPRELSGGEQQRVALGRAIVCRPGVFLFDEPLSNLDGPLRIGLRRELHLLHRRLRATMIYVTHDQAEAMTLGERVAVLEAGILQQVDTPAGLYHRPANRSVAAYVGMPGMNLLDGELSGEGSKRYFGRAHCGWPVPAEVGCRWDRFRGQPLTLGIRPENVSVGEMREDSVSLPMRVTLIEAMGDSTLVSLGNEEWALTASVSVRSLPSLGVGAMLPVELDMTKAHLFDGVTGIAACHPESG
jgi:multiple sugar transport system ATP-binding protein